MSQAFSAEIELALACCRWPRRPETDELVHALGSRVADWARFDAIVRRNRITPLVNDAIGRARPAIPQALRQELSTRALAAGKRALEMARESLRLQRMFDEAGIPVMVVKGIPVGIASYGQLAMKESSDIDILVSPGNAVEALRLLSSVGFEQLPPTFSLSQFVRYLDFAKEVALGNASNRLIVELHWRLVDSKMLLSGVSVDGPAQTVPMPGGELRTLADEPLFAYLCLHGALHNWSRLKWLADLNAFLASRSQESAVRLLRAAEGYGAGRSASVALMLCQRLFGLELGGLPPGIIERNLVTRWLERNGIAGLAYRGGGIEHELYSVPRLRMRIAALFVARGAPQIFEQIRVGWTSPFDRARMALPRSLAFIHHLLRVPLSLMRTGRYLLRRLAA